MSIANVLNQNDQNTQPSLTGANWNFDCNNFAINADNFLQISTTGPVCQIYATAASPDFRGDLTGFFSIIGGTFTFTADRGCILKSNGNAGGNMFVIADTNDLFIQANAGDVHLIPSGDLYAVVPSVGSTAATPTIEPPAGYSYVVRENATGKIFYLT